MDYNKPDTQAGDDTVTSTDHDRDEDFASLFEASLVTVDRSIQRDRKIDGRVVSVGEEWIFVDVGSKTEGIIAREEFTDEEGLLQVNPGDPISAYVVNMRDGEILLSVKMTSAASEEALRSAYASGLPVEGLVAEERKGGYTVNLFGKTAFCPYSQIDIHAGSPQDYIGQRMTFRITQYSDRGRNVVLSRRELLEEERRERVQALRETLKPGDTVQGTVQNVTNFGAFVDIGGVQGLVPMSELAWHRVDKASDILSPGDSLNVRILDLDWDHNRISLSRKQLLDDPWNMADRKFTEGRIFTGQVTRVVDFGAFVQLEPGVEGLAHISNLGMGRRVNHPSEVVSPGDSVDVKVLSVDGETRRIGLELMWAGLQTSGSEAEEELQAGAIVEGTVDAVKNYGVFVSLPGGKTGLLHVSEIDDDDRSGDLRRRFNVGSTVSVQIKSVDRSSGRISLSTKTLKNRDEEQQFKEFSSGGPRRPSFGKLGDLLKGKLSNG